MTDTRIYSALFNLSEMGFIGGTDKVLTLTVYKSDGVTPLNLTGTTTVWRLFPYGQFAQSVLEISGVITSTNTLTITIPSTSTTTISGKFVQQISIAEWSGKVFKAAQGVVIISPAIQIT